MVDFILEKLLITKYDKILITDRYKIDWVQQKKVYTAIQTYISSCIKKLLLSFTIRYQLSKRKHNTFDNKILNFCHILISNTNF